MTPLRRFSVDYVGDWIPDSLVDAIVEAFKAHGITPDGMSDGVVQVCMALSWGRRRAGRWGHGVGAVPCYFGQGHDGPHSWEKTT